MIQSQILNKVLSTKDASILTQNNLTAEYFSDYVAEFNFIKTHLQKYNTVPDKATFSNVFPNFTFVDVTEPDTFLLDELSKDRTLRISAESFSNVRNALMLGDVDNARATILNTATRLSSAVNINPVELIHDHSRFDSYSAKINNTDKYFIKTGFKELDNIITGWDVNEDLVTIVARNGLGKSWVLLKCAAEAARQGKTVGIYSGEMSEDSVGYRIDTILSNGRISNGALVHGNASAKTTYKQFLSELDKNILGHLYVLTPQQIGGNATVTTLQAFIEKLSLDILFIDQHSLLEDECGAKNPIEKASNISKQLKLLQTLKRIPIITVCQQNRTKSDEQFETFDTTQIAQSDRIAQDSSLIIFIERTKSENDDLMKLHIVKSRQTGAGKVLTYKINLDTGTWLFIPEGDNETTYSNIMQDDETIENDSCVSEDVF